MGWPMNTRAKTFNAGSKSVAAGALTAGETLAWDLPKSGILAGIQLVITGNFTTAPSTPNALGKSRLLTRVRLNANAGINLVDLSGEGYHYLVRDFLEEYDDPVPQSDGRSVAASGAFDLSMWLPQAINSRDQMGLVNLQNEDTQLRLELEVGAASRLANDYTVMTLTATPYLEMFAMPLDKKDRPRFDFLHTITEDQQVVAATGDQTYRWPRGNIYLSVVHGMGIAAAGADSFTAASLRLNQNDYLKPSLPPAYYTREFSRTRGRTKLAGTIPFDLVGMSGLGNYGSLRDLIDSTKLTDIESVITASATGTLYSVKRQLVSIPEEK